MISEWGCGGDRGMALDLPVFTPSSLESPGHAACRGAGMATGSKVRQ